MIARKGVMKKVSRRARVKAKPNVMSSADTWGRARTYGFKRADLVPGRTVVENTESRRRGLVISRPGPWTVWVRLLRDHAGRRIKASRPVSWMLNNVHLVKK